jgi:predicted Zn-dependent protease
MSRKSRIILVFTIFFVLFLASCSTVPITGREQLNFIPDSQMNSLSLTEYKDYISKHQVSTNTTETQMVKDVGARIQKAVETYCAQNNLSDRIAGYKWEFNLVVDSNVNAFAMPGGKVVVNTGLIPVAQNEDGLAVVMGHEIAHVIARHGSERMSQGLLVQMGGVALSEAMANSPAQTRDLFAKSYGLGTQYGILLPYSRTQETEADHLGLIFMAMAGYNPNAAIGFWQRMEAANKGSQPIELLSTHPADQTRINNLKKFMPEAMRYYKK